MAEEVQAGGFTADRRIYLIAAVAIVVILIAMFFIIRSCGSVAMGPQMTVIYSQLELKDAANVVAKLKELKIPYEIRDEGRSIAVPKKRADEARLGLAIANLPVGGAVGWEIFDESKLGATDFDRRIQYIRAISGELARTIRSLDSIDDARVQIVIPETRLFEAATAPVTASVLIRLKPGERLTAGQVNGIVHLVASSVENLHPENVTVVDIYGNILSGSTTGVVTTAPVVTTMPPAIVTPPAEVQTQTPPVKPETEVGVSNLEKELITQKEAMKLKEEELKKKELALTEKEKTLNEKTAEKPVEKPAENPAVTTPPASKPITEEELKKKVEEQEKNPKALTAEERVLLRLKIKKEIDDQLSSKAQAILNKFYPPNVAIAKVNVELGEPKIKYVPMNAKLEGTLRKEVQLKAQELVTIRRITAVILIDKRYDVSAELKKDTFASVSGAIGYDRKRGDKIILRKVPFRLAESREEKPTEVNAPGAPALKTSVDLQKIWDSLRALYAKARATPMVGGLITKGNMLKAGAGLIGLLFVLYVLGRVFSGGGERRKREEEEEEVETIAPRPGRRAEDEIMGALGEMRRMASAAPDRIAAMLRAWLGEEAE